MRPVTHDIYGIPAERIIGSSTHLRYQDDETGGTIVYEATMDVFDDGPMKPVRIWSRIGRQPILAGGNSNGDIPMLQYTGGPRPACAPRRPRRRRARVRLFGRHRAGRRTGGGRGVDADQRRRRLDTVFAPFG
jgi:hypothetical protein